MKIIIERSDYGAHQTLGKLYLLNNDNIIVKNYYSLELPDNHNQRRISCIPEGEYTAIKHYSPKHGKCLWLQNVPGRSEILIHKGNYYFNILGCILIGDDLRDLNSDGLQDVVNSKKSVLELLKMINTDKIQIKIVNLV